MMPVRNPKARSLHDRQNYQKVQHLTVRIGIANGYLNTIRTETLYLIKYYTCIILDTADLHDTYTTIVTRDN